MHHDYLFENSVKFVISEFISYNDHIGCPVQEGEEGGVCSFDPQVTSRKNTKEVTEEQWWDFKDVAL